MAATVHDANASGVIECGCGCGNAIFPSFVWPLPVEQFVFEPAEKECNIMGGDGCKFTEEGLPKGGNNANCGPAPRLGGCSPSIGDRRPLGKWLLPRLSSRRCNSSGKVVSLPDEL